MSHTQHLISSRSMQVLSMIEVSVGKRLFSNLLPLLVFVMEFSKDKKLTQFTAHCLDSIFGNVLSLDTMLDKDDALPHVTDERKQKSVLVRKSALDCYEMDQLWRISKQALCADDRQPSEGHKLLCAQAG